MHLLPLLGALSRCAAAGAARVGGQCAVWRRDRSRAGGAALRAEHAQAGLPGPGGGEGRAGARGTPGRGEQPCVRLVGARGFACGSGQRHACTRRDRGVDVGCQPSAARTAPAHACAELRLAAPSLLPPCRRLCTSCRPTWSRCASASGEQAGVGGGDGGSHGRADTAVHNHTLLTSHALPATGAPPRYPGDPPAPPDARAATRGPPLPPGCSELEAAASVHATQLESMKRERDRCEARAQALTAKYGTIDLDSYKQVGGRGGAAGGGGGQPAGVVGALCGSGRRLCCGQRGCPLPAEVGGLVRCWRLQKEQEVERLTKELQEVQAKLGSLEVRGRACTRGAHTGRGGGGARRCAGSRQAEGKQACKQCEAAMGNLPSRAGVPGAQCSCCCLAPDATACLCCCRVDPPSKPYRRSSRSRSCSSSWQLPSRRRNTRSKGTPT